jgi:hypothetical protein
MLLVAADGGKLALGGLVHLFQLHKSCPEFIEGDQAPVSHHLIAGTLGIHVGEPLGP